DAALLREGRGVGHDLEKLFVALRAVLAKREREFDTDSVAVFDLLASFGDGGRKFEIGRHAQRGHVHFEAARGDFLFEAGEIFGRGTGASERLGARGGEQAGVFVARGFDRIERVVVAPLGPRAVEATDWPARRGGFFRGARGGGQQGDGDARGGGGDEIAASEGGGIQDRKSTRLNSSHANISYA